MPDATSLHTPPGNVQSQYSGVSSSRQNRSSYLWRAILLYIGFNVLVSPFSLWLDVYSGWRYDHRDLLLLPFVQGSFFFYTIVLNSDSMFRAFHEGFVLKKPYIPSKVYGIMVANFILILFTFVDFFSREQEISTRLLALHSASLPCQPANMLPAVGDQLSLLVFTLLFGYWMNHIITEAEVLHLGIYQQGENP